LQRTPTAFTTDLVVHARARCVDVAENSMCQSATEFARAEGNAFQPGLFDRRAERAQELATAAAARIGSAAAHRLEAIARSTPIGPAAARLLLVLVP